METMWGIHNDQPSINPVADQAIRVGWDQVGDLSPVAPSREAFKDILAKRMPEIDPRTIAGSAGTLYRFVHEIKEGDMVVCPNRRRRSLDIGRVCGSYEFHPEEPIHKHWRPVEWLVADAPREELSIAARNEIGSATTLFKIVTGREEFERLLAGSSSPVEDYTWTAFYAQLAERFLLYADDRGTFLEKIWNVAESSGVPHLFKYLKSDKHLDGSFGPLRDIDPFTAFASFNRGIKDDARVAIATAFGQVFGVSVDAPTHFSGIPTANNLKSWFIRHEIDRGPLDVENLWQLAKAAIDYSDLADESTRENLVTQFDKCATGNTRLLTMGLYWLCPHTFAAYDSVNAMFVANTFPDLAARLALSAKISGDQFLSNTEILSEWLRSSGSPFSEICELSHAAWMDANASADEIDTHADQVPEQSVPAPDVTLPGDPYDVTAIRDDGCFLSEDELRPMLERLRSKKNLVLQGPPGTGKTWLARRLGWALCNERASQRVQIIQFHPSLTYEDFVRGWRPTATQTGGALSLEDGPFLQLCIEASGDHERDYVLVIEEINRGNPAQVLGELLTLIEADKRNEDSAMRLAYPRDGTERFFVPPNVYLIGTMNVADRSLAIVDMALRRRFAFIELRPSLGADWVEYVSGLGYEPQLLETFGHRIEILNQQITEDDALGRQYCVGHSYFTPAVRLETTGLDTAHWWERVVDTDVRPLLEEYWFDRPQLADAACDRLLGYR